MQHGDHLDVDGRARQAKRFGAQLVELPIAPLLGPLSSKHGPEIERLGLRVGPELSVLQHGPHHPRRVLGAQAEAGLVLVAIREGVHLFGHDVAGAAHAAHKQLGLFEDRRAHLAIAVGQKHLAGHLLHLAPGGKLVFETIDHALDRA